MERIVNIIGLGASSAMVPETGENWGLSCAYKICKLDKIIFMDDIGLLLNSGQEFPEYNKTFEQFIDECPNVEIISTQGMNLLNLSSENKGIVVKPYPLQEAVKLAYGGYFTSSIAYAIVLAILEKVDRIRLYGFELWSGSDANEYTVQAPCVEFWLAFAMGRGIKVEMPFLTMKTSNNNQNFYGYMKAKDTNNYLR